MVEATLDDVMGNLPVRTALEEALIALPTTSAKIRYMNKEGYKTGTIAKVLKIRYQHARNVILQGEPKRG
jgi:hypothetical protein